jgi:hypothetical protein
VPAATNGNQRENLYLFVVLVRRLLQAATRLRREDVAERD